MPRLSWHDVIFLYTHEVIVQSWPRRTATRLSFNRRTYSSVPLHRAPQLHRIRNDASTRRYTFASIDEKSQEEFSGRTGKLLAVVEASRLVPTRRRERTREQTRAFHSRHVRRTANVSYRPRKVITRWLLEASVRFAFISCYSRNVVSRFSFLVSRDSNMCIRTRETRNLCSTMNPRLTKTTSRADTARGCERNRFLHTFAEQTNRRCAVKTDRRLIFQLIVISTFCPNARNTKLKSLRNRLSNTALRAVLVLLPSANSENR